jgi:PAS domain S-box-containing protein
MVDNARATKTMRLDIEPKMPDATGPVPPAPLPAPESRESTIVGLLPRDEDGASGYKKLLQSIYDAALICDAKGRVIDFNARATEFFRCTDSDMARARVDGLISGGDDRLMEQIRQSLMTHRYALIEAFCLRKDRTMFPAEIAVNRINLSEQGQLCFFIRDISVRKRAEQALEEAFARLEEHDRAKSQFVSNVSHELRTPLTSMIYAVANMRKGVAGPITDRQRDYLDILDTDCKRLLRTVNDILDLRKIESKSLALSKSKAPVMLLCRRSIETLRPLADRKRLRLTVRSTGGGRFVFCDAHKIERVLLNVVNNGIKFTPDGGAVAVEVGADPERPGFLSIWVVDTGIGIPKEALPRVTERYFTVGDQPTGTGLGLAISKEIVELHGGRLTIESPAPGMERGTAVRVSLPQADPPLAFVVHPDAAIQRQLAEELRQAGYQVQTHAEGADPYAEVERTVPDLVVTDVAAPGMVGAELLLKMKGSKPLARVPLIVVTAESLGGPRGEVLRNFSIPFVGIPWRAAELLDIAEESFL